MGVDSLQVDEEVAQGGECEVDDVFLEERDLALEPEVGEVELDELAVLLLAAVEVEQDHA